MAVIVSMSTPEPGIKAIRAPFTPRPSITARSSRFCTRIAERSRFSSLAQCQRQRRARETDLDCVAGEYRAESGHRIEANDGKAGGRERSNDGGRQGNVMGEMPA